MAFSSMRNLALSGLRVPLLRSQFERNQLERAQFARSLWKGSKGRLEKDVKMTRGHCSIVKVPPFYRKLKVLREQERIFSILTELYIISEVKLTLGTKGLFSCLYEHGVEDTWRAFVKTMKGKATTSSDAYMEDEPKRMERWLDNVEPLAKEIYQVLVVCHRQKMSKPQGEFHFENLPEIFQTLGFVCHRQPQGEFHFGILPDRFGSILIKLSQFRSKWKAIASLEHGNLLDELDKPELDSVEILIKEVHDFVVVQQVLQE